MIRDHRRAVDARIVLDLMASLCLALENTAERAESPAELGCRSRRNDEGNSHRDAHAM